MSIVAADVVKEMLGAAAGELSGAWDEVEDYARSEFKKFAETLELIERQLVQGKMTPERARLHVDFQKQSMKAVLLTIEGLGILAVERAINAALGVVRDAVNTALGAAVI